MVKTIVEYGNAQRGTFFVVEAPINDRRYEMDLKTENNYYDDENDDLNNNDNNNNNKPHVEVDQWDVKVAAEYNLDASEYVINNYYSLLFILLPSHISYIIIIIIIIIIVINYY